MKTERKSFSFLNRKTAIEIILSQTPMAVSKATPLHTLLQMLNGISGITHLCVDELCDNL